MNRVGAILAGLAFAAALPAAAQTDTSSWVSERKVQTPADRAGGARIMKTVPLETSRTLTLPEPGKGGVVVTHAPPSTLPTLPSDVSTGTTQIAKTPAGADPAYEAFDLGHYIAAMNLARAADDRGEPQAATLIGRLYQEGLGVPKDDVAAAKAYARGAERGDVNAMFAFAVMLAEGGAIKKDMAGAAQMFEKAAAKGHVVANYNLALMFLAGDGKPANPQRGFAHMQYAAEAGLAQAQYDLATLYATGTGVGADAFKAADWYGRAAEAGLPDAEFEYGIVLLAGKGTFKNDRLGARMLRLAAEKGNVVAQNRYARCKANGIGVDADTVEAAGWYLVSKAGGLQDRQLEALFAKLSKTDRLRAEAAAQAFRDREALQ